MFKKLMGYINGYKKAAVLAPTLVAIETICELMMPLIMANILDIGIEGDGGFSYILKCGLMILVLSLFSMGGGVFAAKYATAASQGFGANLRRSMFDKVQDFSFADIDRFSSASLITRMTNDVTQIQNLVNMGLRMVVRMIFMLIASLVICFSIHAKLSLILVVAMPVMGIAIGSLMSVCHKLFKRFQEKIDGLNDSVQENLIAIRVVKAFVREKYEKAKFQKRNDELTSAALAAVMRVVWMGPIMMISCNLCIIFALWFGGKFVIGESMLYGDLYSFISYIGNVLFSVMMFAMTLLNLTRAKACAERILEVLDTTPDIRNSDDCDSFALPERRGSIEFRDVSFRYVATGTGDDVLSHIDLKIEPGEFVAVIGGTGTGKSSLVNLIPRFYDVTGGAVLVDGADVRDYPIEALRDRIGMVLQNNVLFSGTIRENLLWGNPDATEEEIITAAKNAQAYDFIMSFPDGFDTYIDQGGVNVSGGQKQRLCIARAMLRKPEILILDDSTSAVDSATEAKIRESFSENLKGTTVIIIAQRISSVRHADKIVILDDDHIAGIGTHDELMASNEIYQEIYQSQQEGVSE